MKTSNLKVAYEKIPNSLPIKGFKGYHITKEGVVISYKYGKTTVLKATQLINKQPLVNLSKSSRGKKHSETHYICRLLVNTYKKYIKDYSVDKKVAYIDGDYNNCNLKNICLKTQGELTQIFWDSKKEPCSVCGVGTNTNDNVCTSCKRINSLKMGIVKRAQVSNKARTTRNKMALDLNKVIALDNKPQPLSKVSYLDIYKLLLKGFTYEDIANAYDITRQAVGSKVNKIKINK